MTIDFTPATQHLIKLLMTPDHNSPHDAALKYTQAVLNLAHAESVMADTRKYKQ